MPLSTSEWDTLEAIVSMVDARSGGTGELDFDGVSRILRTVGLSETSIAGPVLSSLEREHEGRVSAEGLFELMGNALRGERYKEGFSSNKLSRAFSVFKSHGPRGALKGTIPRYTLKNDLMQYGGLSGEEVDNLLDGLPVEEGTVNIDYKALLQGSDAESMA